MTPAALVQLGTEEAPPPSPLLPPELCDPQPSSLGTTPLSERRPVRCRPLLTATVSWAAAGLDRQGHCRYGLKVPLLAWRPFNLSAGRGGNTSWESDPWDGPVGCWVSADYARHWRAVHSCILTRDTKPPFGSEPGPLCWSTPDHPKSEAPQIPLTSCRRLSGAFVVVGGLLHR